MFVHRLWPSFDGGGGGGGGGSGGGGDSDIDDVILPLICTLHIFINLFYYVFW